MTTIMKKKPIAHQTVILQLAVGLFYSCSMAPTQVRFLPTCKKRSEAFPLYELKSTMGTRYACIWLAVVERRGVLTGSGNHEVPPSTTPQRRAMGMKDMWHNTCKINLEFWFSSWYPQFKTRGFRNSWIPLRSNSLSWSRDVCLVECWRRISASFGKDVIPPLPTPKTIVREEGARTVLY